MITIDILVCLAKNLRLLIMSADIVLARILLSWLELVWLGSLSIESS